jgi:hypothetical protein
MKRLVVTLTTVAIAVARSPGATSTATHDKLAPGGANHQFTPPSRDEPRCGGVPADQASIQDWAGWMADLVMANLAPGT